MRRMTRRVARAFEAGQPLNVSPSLWTSGGAIYSYATCIAIKWGNRRSSIVLNGTKYSHTTSRIQAELRELFPKARVVAGSEIFVKQPSRNATQAEQAQKLWDEYKSAVTLIDTLQDGAE